MSVSKVALDGDVGSATLQPSSSEYQRSDKGKQRASEPSRLPEADDEQEAREIKSVEETLRRWRDLENKRRACRRKNAASVMIAPPLSDLSRAGSHLIRRASRSTRSSLQSRKSSMDSIQSFPSVPSYATLSRPTTRGSLGLTEVKESMVEEGGVDGFADVIATSPPLPFAATAAIPEATAAYTPRYGSRFVEDIESQASRIPTDLSRPPQLPSMDSSYSLPSLGTVRSFYSQPLSMYESTTLLTREDEHEVFGAGFRQSAPVTVPWYEALFCCACVGGENEDREQTGQTMPG